jgi:hypothetical protein
VRGIEHVQFAPTDAKPLTERAMSRAVAKQIIPIIGQTFPTVGLDGTRHKCPWHRTFWPQVVATRIY